MTTFKTAKHVEVGDRVEAIDGKMYEISSITKQGRAIFFRLVGGVGFSCSPSEVLAVEVAR